MRVIQDSDDELEDDLEADVSTTNQPGATEQQLTNDTQQRGTGSTESLKRAIEQAHRAHLQSQVSQNEPQSSVSLPEHPSKRRKILADDDLQKLPEAALLEEDDFITHSKRSGKVVTGEVASSNQGDLSMEGTMRDSYIRHEPMMLFPEPSSTVPNATLTQQRVMETVTAPTMLGNSGADTPHHHFPPDPSVSLSDTLFPPSITSEQPESTNQEHTTQYPPTDASLETPRQEHEVPILHQSEQSSSIHLQGNPLQDKSQNNNISPEGCSTPHGKTEISKYLGTAPTSSSKSRRNTRKEISRSPGPQKSRIISISSSDDDLAAVGLPVEQYKPRPSRSRSLKVDSENPIDYSLKPENAKKGSKRRKTTPATKSSNATTTPEKVRQICDMGFTPSTTKSALKQNSGNVTRTVEWLVRNGIGEDELASHTTPKRKPALKESHELPSMDHETIKVIMHGLNEYRRDDPGSVQNAETASVVMQPAMVENDTKLSTLDEPETAVQNVSPKVQVVIAKKSTSINAQTPSSGEASSRKTKRRKTASNQPEPEPLLTDHIEPEIKRETKRGRGRPKKTANPAPPADTTLEVLEADSRRNDPVGPRSIDSGFDPAPDLSTEMQLDTQTIGAQTLEPENRQEEAPIAEPPPKTTLTTNISQTPSEPTKPGSHSPNDKGKASYRVGLSKRARIAPLLRTLKK
ncbi:hypothetical protein N0V83_003155 [Neocucurbitaria cava]|uniref:UBA domain-containing protein n=1 Tax=Neocucurbitaria cava TaxID=798079 RepID=A0A9W8YB61_9PLEO|nr:hypothetical protein N0V83_003155 [Neocucurbitaria cava]